LEVKKMRVNEVYEDYYRSPEEYGDEEGIMGGTIEAWTKGRGSDYTGGSLRRKDEEREGRRVPHGLPVSVGGDGEIGSEVRSVRGKVYDGEKIRVKVSLVYNCLNIY
jgi:hypothetical protein